MPIQTSSKRRAALAVLFAGSMLNSATPAPCEPSLDNESDAQSSIIWQMCSESSCAPERRASALLSLAYSYLQGGSRATIERYHEGWQRRSGTQEQFRNGLQAFSRIVCRGTIGNPPTSTASGSADAIVNHSSLASSAIEAAVELLPNSRDSAASLYLYFVVSKLSEVTGNQSLAKKCRSIVEGAIKSCETRSNKYQSNIEAVASILDAEALEFLPVDVPARPLLRKSFKGLEIEEVRSYREEQFRESEKLKLRALAVVDQLPAANHARRLAHRNMTLWYSKLGKDELAEKEKQILFDLVGIKDDRILYPLSLGCGMYVWWQVELSGIVGSCGMG